MRGGQNNHGNVKNKKIKKEGSAVPEPRVGVVEMSCGGGGRGGVLARAAALGDGHLRLLLQLDVDHWGGSVKRLQP